MIIILMLAQPYNSDMDWFKTTNMIFYYIIWVYHRDHVAGLAMELFLVKWMDSLLEIDSNLHDNDGY